MYRIIEKSVKTMKQFYTITEISAIIHKSQSFLYRSAKIEKLQVKKKVINGKEITIVEADALQKFHLIFYACQYFFLLFKNSLCHAGILRTRHCFFLRVRLKKKVLIKVFFQEFLQSRDLKSEIKEALQEVVEEQKRSLVLRYDEKYREMELRIQELTEENERLRCWWKFWK